MGEMCEKCKKKPVEIEFIEIVEGEKKIKKLCKECAEEEAMGISSSPSLPIKKKEEIKEENKICPNCGLSLFEFFKKTKVGCENCYDAFGEAIMKLIQKIHGSSFHKGRKYVPKYKVTKDFKIKILERALKDAVEKEEFERAAKLRDILKWLKTKSDG
ncbi:MAG: UvrB/UvrC motif-containing protein [candidate division WOR-3 bacterium]